MIPCWISEGTARNTTATNIKNLFCTFPGASLKVSPTIDTVPDELAACAGEQPDGVEEAAVEEGELDAAQFSDQEAEFGDGFMPDDLMSSEKIDGPKASYLSVSCHVDTE